jgi:hypothetical protein
MGNEVLKAIKWGVTATSLCAAVLTAMPAMPAAANPTQCDPGSSSWKWTNVKKPWVVTHAKSFENFSGATIKRTKSVTHETTITASASTTVGTKFKANAIIAKLDATVEFTLALSGSHTNKGTETVEGTMKSGHVYIYYAGAKKITGHYTYRVCNSRGEIVVKSSGNGKSYGLKTEGVVQCGASPKKTTLAYKVENAYC